MALKEVNQRVKPLATTAFWVISCSIFVLCDIGNAHRQMLRSNETVYYVENEMKHGFVMTMIHFLWEGRKSSYEHIWPDMELGWRLVLGSVIGFFGSALGSVGGVGGGGIFVPMLTLIIGFDPKSSTAISKCMIMGAAGSTVYYNLRLRHSTLDMPLIDYDLALLFQPMLMLGISIGVVFNVVFADWMVTVLLIILFIELGNFLGISNGLKVTGTSTKALSKGVSTWKKETLMKKEAAKMLESEPKPGDGSGEEYRPLASSPSASVNETVTMRRNIYWKELGLLAYVWIAFLAIQILKTYTVACSIQYWILNSLQIPVSFSITLYEAISLRNGTRVVASKGKELTNWKPLMLFLYCCCGIVAGMVGGLLGLGGGFILGPLFLELGIPPLVASATSAFAMAFSSSMSVVQYYLLKRFPVPYASYFVIIATIAAFTGQHVVKKVIALIGRASIIIFILALMILVSAISLGGVGIANMITKLERKEYMGFENLCKNS